ncbi:MAG: DMT family transporter [Bacteroidales bacterium]|nr:DMT family transporter [Bacteroidales bacterium]
MKNKSELIKVYVGLLFAMFFWGLSFVGTKYALLVLHPISLVLIRLFISVVFLLILGYSFNLLDKIKPGHGKWFLILGFFEPFLYFMGETYGLKLVSPTIGSIIISTIPLFVPWGAFIFFKEKIYWKNFLGILISVIGVILTMLNKNMEFTASWTGVGLVMIAVVSAIVYTLLIRYIAQDYSALSIITYQNIIGIPMFIPFFIIYEFKEFTFASIDNNLWMVLFLLGIFPSSLSYLFYTYSVKKIGVSKTSVFVNLIPIITAIASYILFNEEFSLMKLFGIMTVIAGLYLSQSASKENNATSPSI